MPQPDAANDQHTSTPSGARGNVVAVIPARGGSKRMPGKNLAQLAGRSLVGHSVAAGLESPCVDRVLVSTDDAAIASEARRSGAEVPFLRPEALAGDTVSDLPVLLHAIDFLRRTEGYETDLVVLLRPTTPFRAPDLIERCVERLHALDADSVRSVRAVGHAHPYWTLTVDDAGMSHPFVEGKGVDTYYQRQLLPPAFKHDGYCDVFRTGHFPAECGLNAGGDALFGTRRGVLENETPYLVNIDSPEDFHFAEYVAYRMGHDAPERRLA